MKKFFTKRGSVLSVFITVILIFIFGCEKKEGGVNSAITYDPSKPVKITDFFPKEGGGGQQLVIYGDNFGNDTSLLDVFIDDQAAVVIGMNNKAIYCIVPDYSYDGTVRINIGEGQTEKSITADEKFQYERRTVVTTLCGEVDDRGNYDIKDGPFDDCGGFRNPTWFKFDPKNPDLLYMAQDGGDIRLIDFSDSMVTTPITRGMGNWGRLRAIDFTLDGNHMVVATPQPNKDGIGVSISSRANNFQDPQILTSYSGVDNCAIHPVNGELYFVSYQKGNVFRFDMDTYFEEGLGPKDFKELYKIQDNEWSINFIIHPSGNYAYIVIHNRHYILRTDYNWDTQKFMVPYVICGKARVAGWNDGVGASARLNSPFQGVFVKNPDYAGMEDEYDFYFTEVGNHDIRVLTPKGRVTTFAGRGSPTLDEKKFGHVDGALRTEARFDEPKAIAYDEKTKTFYIGEAGANHDIRKIALEGE